MRTMCKCILMYMLKDLLNLVYSTVYVFLEVYIYSVAVKTCGSNLQGPSGTFTSPNFPIQYESNSQCVWIITASDPNKVGLLCFSVFQVFAIGPSLMKAHRPLLPCGQPTTTNRPLHRQSSIEQINGDTIHSVSLR